MAKARQDALTREYGAVVAQRILDYIHVDTEAGARMWTLCNRGKPPVIDLGRIGGVLDGIHLTDGIKKQLGKEVRDMLFRRLGKVKIGSQRIVEENYFSTGAIYTKHGSAKTASTT